MLGQDLAISYKPGAGGAVGWSQLNSLQADGYTIMGVNLPHIIVKPMQHDVGFKTDDLGVFYFFHYTPDAIVVAKDSPFKTVKDLIDYAKKNPGRVTFSGSGRGTSNDLAHARFDKLTGIKTTYIPFKGTGAAVTALLGGKVKTDRGVAPLRLDLTAQQCSYRGAGARARNVGGLDPGQLVDARIGDNV